jgi:hypothetical protein
MSNDMFQIATAGIVLVQLVALVWAVAVRRGTRAVLWVNLLLAAGVLIYWVPALSGEFAQLAAAEPTELLDYQAPLLCLVELVTLLASGLRMFGRGMPATTLVSWLGFAFNFCFSLMFLVIAFFFQFGCCGYL